LNCSKAFDSKFANSSGVMLSVFKLKVTNCLLTQRTEFSLHPRFYPHEPFYHSFRLTAYLCARTPAVLEVRIFSVLGV
ncbi:MAG: hypothetical protein ACJA1C_002763, partial [Crocinitomicaceae bacterium]